MKLLRDSTRILTVVLSLAALVAFFFTFATITTANGSVSLTGSQLAFGGKTELNDVTYEMAKSADVLFCMILAAFSTVMAGLAFTKSRSARWFHVLSSAVAAVYMLVIALSKPNKFVDTRPLQSVTGVSYSSFVLIASIILFAALISGIAFILAADYVEAAESGDGRLTIPKKVAKFLKDYKGEIKKIVWPGPRSVVKNTLIVFAICLIVGAFVWLLDYGLSAFIDWVTTLA